MTLISQNKVISAENEDVITNVTFSNGILTFNKKNLYNGNTDTYVLNLQEVSLSLEVLEDEEELDDIRESNDEIYKTSHVFVVPTGNGGYKEYIWIDSKNDFEEIGLGVNLTNYYTKQESDNKYLTQHQPLNNYYTKQESDAKYLTQLESLNDYYTKNEINSKFIPYTTEGGHEILNSDHLEDTQEYLMFDEHLLYDENEKLLYNNSEIATLDDIDDKIQEAMNSISPGQGSFTSVSLIPKGNDSTSENWNGVIKFYFGDEP